MTSRRSGSVVVGTVGLLDLPTYLQIRRVVFIDAQGVPEDLEVDGLDSECTHFLAWESGAPVGTARMRVLGSAAKAERVAVLPGSAGQGFGRRLMDALEREAAASGLARVELHSQEQVIPFYEELGYVGDDE